jgi:hypothetical protein
MSKRAWIPLCSLMMFVIALLTFTGCASSRRAKRANQELEEARMAKDVERQEEANAVKELERHYIYKLKPERDLQDPLWTPP